MTERGKAQVGRAPDQFTVGPSSLRVDDGALVIDIDETSVPVPRRVRGRVVVRPDITTSLVEPLDARGRHVWTPYAPRARLEVSFEAPALSWSGRGYLDGNAGSEPLHHAFATWTWARAALAEGAAVIYDVVEAGGERHGLCLHVGPDGGLSRVPPPPTTTLPRTRWGIAQSTRSESGQAIIARRLEDTPFYARSLVEGRLFGEPVTMVHETLDLARVVHPVVRLMLPFRMPRRS